MTSIFKQFAFKKLGPWLTKLAFWRKHAAETDAVPDESVETPTADEREAVVRPERKAKPAQIDAPDDDVDEATQIDAPKPRFFARIKQIFTRRRKPVEAASEDESQIEEAGATTTPDEPAAPKLSLAARLKRLLRFRRKVIDAADADENDKTQVIEKPRTAAADADQDGEAEAPPPSRLKRLIARLRSKWVWIPALSFVVVGLVSWLVIIMLLATHEKERLQVELKTAKKLLEQKKVSAEKPPAPAPLPPPPAAPEKPAPKVDPAFQIVGHVPVPQAEETSGVDAGDCLVKDKESVAANLKNCITSFNEAVASTPKKSKTP